VYVTSILFSKRFLLCSFTTSTLTFGDMAYEAGVYGKPVKSLLMEILHLGREKELKSSIIKVSQDGNLTSFW
jgi:hypothetical protein